MKNFDEKIRDKIYDAEMPVSDHLWDFIDSQISTKKERPKYLVFFMASLILFPMAFIGVNYFTEKDTNKNKTRVELKNNHSKYLNIDNSVNVSQSQRMFISDLPLLENRKLIKYFDIPNKGNQNLSFQIVTRKPRFNKNVNDINSKLISSVPILDKRTFSYNEMKIENESSLKPIKFNASTPQCPSFNPKPISYYAYFNGTMSAPFQSLSSLSIEDDLYIQRRSNTESAYVSYNFDVGVGIQLDDHFFIEAGMSYNKINNKFYLKEDGQIKNTTIITIDTTFDNAGNVLDIETNTFIVQEQGTTETTALNSFTQIDIPVSIGYRIPVTPMFNITASAGAILNLKSSSIGTILNKGGEPMSILGGISDGQLYKSKVGMSYIGSIKLETELYNNFYLNTGLNMRYYANEFNSSLNPIKEKYFSVGIGAGIRYML